MDLLYPKPTKLQKNLLQFFFLFHVGLETILFRMKVEMEYLDLNFSFFFEAYGLQCFNFFVGNICRKLQFQPPTFNNSQSDFFKCSKFGGEKEKNIHLQTVSQMEMDNFKFKCWISVVCLSFLTVVFVVF